DTCNTFLAFAHKSGLYVFTGLSPEWVAYDMTGRMTDVCWDNVNWSYEHLIYVMIDEDTKTVRVGVPMGQSTSVNIEFVVDYSRGSIDITATGVGEVLPTIYPLRSPSQAMDTIELAGGDASDRSMRFHGQNERWSIELSNGNIAGNWFTLQRVIFWVQLVWKV